MDGKISDSEFISALQFLVEKEILTIPDKNAVNSIVSKEPVSSKSTSEQTYADYVPNLVAFNMEGNSILLILEVLNFDGNPISVSNAEMHIQILDFDDDEIFKYKTYLTTNSFTDFTNDVSGKDAMGFKYVIQKGKIKQSIVQDDLHANGLGTMVLTLTIKGEKYSNSILLDHLPINEGYFNEKTGFTKKIDVDQSLKIGNFFVSVKDAGHYIGEDLNDGKKLKNYFRINLNTKSTEVSGVTFTLDEAYLEDTQGNVYVSDPISIDNYVNSFLGTSFEYEGGNGYLLFEEIPIDTSQLKFTIKISRIQMDESQTQFSDEINFSLE